MEKLVSYQVKNSIATIVMDDGKANVMSVQMQSEVNAALDAAIKDKAMVLLTGREGTFSAGFDLGTLTAGGAHAVEMVAGGFKLAERLLSFPKPVIMACSGHAMAMGAFLLLCGDYRIGVHGAFKIGANEVAIGLTVPKAAIEICRDRLVPAHFNRSVLTSEIYQPEDAVSAGFLDRIVEKGSLLEEAQRLADAYTKLNMAAYVNAKARVREVFLKNLRSAIEEDTAYFRSFFNRQ